MKKKIKFLILLSLLIISCSFSFIHADDDIYIRINGLFYHPEDELFIENGATLVPLRFISENLGLSIKWTGTEKKVEISGKNNKVSLKIGSKTAYIGNEKQTLPTPAKIINSKTYVPISFIAKSFNIPVNWDGKKRIVDIGKNNIAIPNNPNMFIKGNIESKVAIYPENKKNDDTIIIDLFKEKDNFTLVLGEELGEKDLKGITGYWYSINTQFETGLEKEELYKDKKIDKNAIIQATFADLDKDGQKEMIVAVRDKAIDGMFSVIKIHNFIEIGDGLKTPALRSEILGTEYFQTEIRIDKKGHLIIPIGSQGLFTEYELKNKKLVEVKHY